MIKGTGRSKEGFSVCSLLDRTVSPGGKKLLRTWCRQPSTDLDVLLHRHDAGDYSHSWGALEWKWAAPPPQSPRRHTVRVACPPPHSVEFCMHARAQLPEIWREYRGHAKVGSAEQVSVGM